MTLLPCGDRALMAEFATAAEARAAHARWSTERPRGIIELVPGARTVLVCIDPTTLGLGAAESWLRAHPPLAMTAPSATPRSVTIPIVYDGDDLALVAEHWGCSPEAVAERHQSRDWVCAFIGFAPGFPYLVPAQESPADRLPVVPRRTTSRPSVAAGSVALAAEYCGIYPRSSPGGWQLIGRTDAVLWDSGRSEPALVTPGTLVRFTPVRAISVGTAGFG